MAGASLLVGMLGERPLAANQIILSAGSALYMLPLGLSIAVMVRIGHLIGAGQVEALRRTAWAVLGLTAAWMALAGGLLYALGGPLSRAFTQDAVVAGLAAQALLVMAFMQLGDGVQSVAVGILLGLRDFAGPARISIAAYWLAALPLSWVGGVWFGWGLAGVWGGFGCGLSVAAVLLVVRIRRRLALPLPG